MYELKSLLVYRNSIKLINTNQDTVDFSEYSAPSQRHHTMQQNEL